MGSTIIPMAMKRKCLGLLKVLEIIHFSEEIHCRKSRLQRQKVVCSAVFDIISCFENGDKILSILLCNGRTVTQKHVPKT
jgi:hypothetical protein